MSPLTRNVTEKFWRMTAILNLLLLLPLHFTLPPNHLLVAGPQPRNVTLKTLRFAAYWVVCWPWGSRSGNLLLRGRHHAAFE